MLVATNKNKEGFLLVYESEKEAERAYEIRGYTPDCARIVCAGGYYNAIQVIRA